MAARTTGPAPSGPDVDRRHAGRAAAVAIAQLGGAAGYGAHFAFGEVPEPFSFRDWAYMLLPPAIFTCLFVAGLFAISAPGVAVWQRVLCGVGCALAIMGLVVGLLLLPLNLFGSFMDYTVG